MFGGRSMKKLIALALAGIMLFSVAGCSGENNEKDGNSFMIAMVTDTGGVNDQSFNQSSWEGLQKLKADTGAEVKYVESIQATDYETNLDKLIDEGCNLIWGIGYSMSDSLDAAARNNPDVNYAIADNSYGDNTADNVTGVMFDAQESAFLVGYIAGKTTKTNAIGFVGGIKSAVIDQFEYGYRAGVSYAAKELSKNIEVKVQYVESFSDPSKGKATAKKMFDSGVDIVFHASGGAGTGVIEAAKDSGKFAIGVDRDQSYLAPDNVLTSAMKMVGNAIQIVSKEFMDGKQIGGQTQTFGLKDNCVGIPEDNKNMDKAVYDAAMVVKQKIIDGEIVPPQTETEFNSYINS